MIDLGSPFPEFSLLDQDGVTHAKASLLGGPTVVYFYPKDDT
ncbi:MAG: redoxin domain-containing protein, partial [Armatimonadetes bacterium]|nr:redoxin domain-containing protein [Armatimonadota bacterium]